MTPIAIDKRSLDNIALDVFEGVPFTVKVTKPFLRNDGYNWTSVYGRVLMMPCFGLADTDLSSTSIKCVLRRFSEKLSPLRMHEVMFEDALIDTIARTVCGMCDEDFEGLDVDRIVDWYWMRSNWYRSMCPKLEVCYASAIVSHDPTIDMYAFDGAKSRFIRPKDAYTHAIGDFSLVTDYDTASENGAYGVAKLFDDVTLRSFGFSGAIIPRLLRELTQDDSAFEFSYVLNESDSRHAWECLAAAVAETLDDRLIWL